jgi:hypothetical protein
LFPNWFPYFQHFSFLQTDLSASLFRQLKKDNKKYQRAANPKAANIPARTDRRVGLDSHTLQAVLLAAEDPAGLHLIPINSIN